MATLGQITGVRNHAEGVRRYRKAPRGSLVIDLDPISLFLNEPATQCVPNIGSRSPLIGAILISCGLPTMRFPKPISLAARVGLNRVRARIMASRNTAD